MSGQDESNAARAAEPLNSEYIGAHFADFSLFRDSFSGRWDKYCNVSSCLSWDF